MNRCRIGVIGAGAVTEIYHLPAARVCPEIEVVALVDIQRHRAERLSRRFGVARVAADHRELFGDVDGVINALPHHLHGPVTVEFLERGTAVLVEKPMALTVAEAEEMIAAARRRSAILQVAHMLRFTRGARLVKTAIADDWLGPLRGFSLEAGFAYDWPAASGFFFSRAQAGGGVLVDLGSHMLDLLLWWLGGVHQVLDYRDDALGGVEAECRLSMALGSPTGPVPGTVTLSRLRKLRDMAIIEGARFTLELEFAAPHALRLRPRQGEEGTAVFVSTPAPAADPAMNFYAAQLRAFARAIMQGGESPVPGESALGTVALVEQCYAQRRQLEYPWDRPRRVLTPVQ